MNLQFHGYPYTVLDTPNPVGFYIDEAIEIRDRYWNIKEKDIVFDIGAAGGLYTIPALACGAYVHSFEPIPTQVKHLVDNVNLNKGFAERFTLHPFCLGKEARTNVLLNDLGVEHTIGPIDMGPLDRSDVVTLDSLNLGRVDWMKLDTEGMEYEILQGGINTLTTYHPKLIIEDHRKVNNIGPWMIENEIWQKLIALLMKAGYTYMHHHIWARDFLIAS